MISRKRLRHNISPPGALLVPLALASVLSLAALLLSACGGAGSDSGAGRTTSACGVELRTEAWDGFKAIWDEFEPAGEVPLERAAAWGATPSCRAWRSSMDAQSPPPVRLRNWFTAAFAGEKERGKPIKASEGRAAMKMSYRYSQDHRAAIDSLLVILARPDSLCALAGRIAAWGDPENLPDPLVVAFLPTKPELRTRQDTLIIDTGVLAAGGVRQTMSQIASLAYRTYLAPQPERPDKLEGEESLAASFSRLRTEGVAAYIEDRLETYFKGDHPSLRHVSFIGRDMAYTAKDMIAYSDTVLPRLMADPQALRRGAPAYARVLAASGAFSKLGYVMAATIAGNLGVDRLKEAAPISADFLAAYQEAAALNPEPRPLPGQLGHPWYASARPFAAEAYEPLHAILARHGP